MVGPFIVPYCIVQTTPGRAHFGNAHAKFQKQSNFNFRGSGNTIIKNSLLLKLCVGISKVRTSCALKRNFAMFSFEMCFSNCM